MGLYGRVVRRVVGIGWVARVARTVAPPLDRLVFRVSRGRRLATPASVPTLMLTTTGRHSGEPRTVPLSYVVHDGVEHVVGTNWGQGHQPAWALNLLADPGAVVATPEGRWEVRALRVPDTAMGDVWPVFESMLPAYGNYRRRLDRPIHMFRLERV